MLRNWLTERTPRLWVLWAASRPSQLALITLVYFLGVGLAVAGEPVVREPFAISTLREAVIIPVGLGLFTVLLGAVSIHYANEYVDVETDRQTSRTAFSGGSGALPETGLERGVLIWPVVIVTALTTTVGLGGLYLGLLDPLATGLLMVILVLGLGYSLPPLQLMSRGLGEVTNVLLGGILLPLFGVAVVARPGVRTVLAVIPFALLVGCNLLATHWPDRTADEAVGKRTLAVRWSTDRIRLAYTVLGALAVGIPLLLWKSGVFPLPVLLAHLLPLPFLGWGWIVLTRQRNPLPSVAAMVTLGITATAAWWGVGLGWFG